MLFDIYMNIILAFFALLVRIYTGQLVTNKLYRRAIVTRNALAFEDVFAHVADM